MIEITGDIQIEDNEIEWSFVRSGGPGGQNVNKVASKAQLRWFLQDNESLPDEVKERLYKQQKRRMTTDGEMLITSQRYRDQERNRRDCLDKLRNAVLRAMKKPKPRKKTKPSRASKERRLQAKKHRSQVKARRQPPEMS